MLRFVRTGSGTLSFTNGGTYDYWSSLWDFTAIPKRIRVRQFGYQEYVEHRKPLNWWKLNEDSGTIATNYGTLQGIVDAEYIGAVSLGGDPLVPIETAAVDGSVGFNGVAHTYVSLPGNSQAPTMPRTQITVNLWFRASNVSSRQVIYKMGNFNDGFSIYLDPFVPGQAKLYFNAYHTSGPNAQRWGPTFCSTTILVNTTYFVTCVFSPSGVKLYLNGELVSQSNSPPVGSLQGVNSSIIGGDVSGVKYHDFNGSGFGDFFSGTLEHVVLFDDAMS
jgi:hypothetical protein